jgi:threonine dehydrogenase-like Zn-dependent dehydrogenase
LAGPRSLRSRQRLLRDLPPGWMRVRFLYCGICGSDISHFEGRPGTSYPITVGHEFIAEVVAIGAEVEDFSPGDIVTSDLNFRCGCCDHCEASRSHLCRIGQQGLFTNRGFADFGDIHASYLLRLGGAPGVHMTLTEPLSCVLHAKRWAALESSDRVLVIGAGSIGLCMAFALCHQPEPAAFEITDRMSDRLAAIAAPITPVGVPTAAPEGEYDIVFDLSGTEDGLRDACAHVRSGGRICSMSHPNADPISPFFVSTILREDITFTVSYLNGEKSTMRDAASLLERHWGSAWGDLIEVVQLDQLQHAHENRHRSSWCKTVVRVSPDQP